MTDQELDRMMRRVLLDAARLDEAREEDAPPAFDASSRHRRQVRAMLADPLGWSRRRERPVWRQALGRAAAFALVCTLFFGSVMAVSPTAWAAVMRWMVELSEHGITYWYTGEQNAEPMPRYEITALPEGFVEVERIEMSNYIRILYQNEDNGNQIFFNYVHMQQGTLTDISAEDADISQTTVNGLPGQLFLSKDPSNLKNTITWVDADNNLQFTVTAALDKTSILHIAESVSLEKFTK